MAPTSASPLQYREYEGCTSSGCIPQTIVPKTSGFWPNADVLVGLQTQEQLQQQVQRDDSVNTVAPGDQSNIASSTPAPVIYIARAGSEQYKYSVSSSTPSPVGSGVSWNSGGNQGVQSQFGNTGYQNQGSQYEAYSNFGEQSSQQGSSSSTGQNTQNSQNSQSQGSSGFQNTQNPYNQASSNGLFGSGSQNAFGSSNTNSGTSSGSTNQFGTSGSVVSQNSQNTAQQGQSGGTSGFSNGNIAPFGPNLVAGNSQMGPMSGGVQPPPFSDKDWNFHPGSHGVHFVGNERAGQSGNGMNRGMSEEAQQIAGQIQAIRDNLSITRDESDYLINQLKASLPPELQNQLQSV